VGNDNQSRWEEASQLLFEAAKVMIPVTTGFLILLAGSFGKIWDMKKDLPGMNAHLLLHTTLLGVGSLAFWVGVIPFCILSKERGSQTLFKCGQGVARVGTIILFAAFICGAWFFWNTFSGKL
jgi:hypothetical protein